MFVINCINIPVHQAQQQYVSFTKRTTMESSEYDIDMYISNITHMTIGTGASIPPQAMVD